MKNEKFIVHLTVALIFLSKFLCNCLDSRNTLKFLSFMYSYHINKATIFGSLILTWKLYMIFFLEFFMRQYIVHIVCYWSFWHFEPFCGNIGLTMDQCIKTLDKVSIWKILLFLGGFHKLRIGIFQDILTTPCLNFHVFQPLSLIFKDFWPLPKFLKYICRNSITNWQTLPAHLHNLLKPL